MSIKDLIRILAKSGEKFYSEIARVKSVNSDRTCDVIPINGDIEIYDVKLQANISQNTGLVIYPKVNSYVLVSFLDKNNAFVALTTDIDKFEVIIGDYSFTIDNSGIVFNDGSYGGLIKIADLVTKLNNIENDLNTLKGVFSGWVTAGGDGGAALKAAATTWYGQPLIPTTKNDLENKKVKHG